MPISSCCLLFGKRSIKSSKKLFSNICFKTPCLFKLQEQCLGQERMPKNVEIKAKIKDFNKAKEIAKNLCDGDPLIINQEDTFFNTFRGRLKLRNFQDDSVSQLIFYERPDIENTKISDYCISSIKNPQDLTNILESALGVKGKVKKTRLLYLYGETRIHIDRIKGLGEFLEFEVVLSPNQSIKEGEDIANFLMKKFGINKEDLIKESYFDLLKKNI